MDLSARRDLNNGFGDALSRAFEFAATPALFGGAGYFIDRWLDTTPLFMVLLAVWAIVAQTVLWWYRYDAKMKKIEAELVARRDAGRLDESGVRVDAAAAGRHVPEVSDGLLPAGVTLEDGPR